MKTLEDYLATIDQPGHRQIMADLIQQIREDYPDLKLEIKWNQPMFVMDGTFILAFSASKNHFSISPEEKGVKEFSDYMDEHDISYSKMLFRMPWDPEKIDYALIKQVIDFNMEVKEGYEKFWRAD